ncbi:hypothetical protein BY996DRAFT_2544985 [Phakopsora pachyrhizi]|uniref:Expressed protein n=1 Tax=Phakopsora pachyrhizi TaxID=170000 RepID=A0AAV0B827_PHAPC|nr:hypothetical protein BY996DRAFT_2544985 [Phakopsora pachyrhizi]CAH7682216.1 expressed protein [Phakopsora pachyrhizi]
MRTSIVNLRLRSSVRTSTLMIRSHSSVKGHRMIDPQTSTQQPLSVRQSSSDLQVPWFVQDHHLVPSPTQASSTIGGSLADTPLPPSTLPSNVSDNLSLLHHHLVQSPFFDQSSITFIDAKLSKGHEAWTDWVILVNLRYDRENSIRAATESIRYLISSLGLTNEPIKVEGINHSTSSPTTAWSFIDCGKFVVNIMTERSREVYNLEAVWSKKYSI